MRHSFEVYKRNAEKSKIMPVQGQGIFKVFVSVGTHEKPFNRLLKALDEIALNSKNFSFFAQTGSSDYKPKNFEFKAFLSDKEFKEQIEKADIVLSHAGAGIIIHSLALNKRLVLMPRMKKFNEHSNDHQFDLALKLSNAGKSVMLLDENNLENALLDSLSLKPEFYSTKENLSEVLHAYLISIQRNLK